MLSRLQLFIAALLFSTGGAAIKSCSLSSWQIASFRSAVAALALFALLPAARRGWTRSRVGVGMAYASTLVLFVSATKLTTAANAIFLQSTAPLYIVLLGPWLLHEPNRRRDVVFMAALAIGLTMFFADADRAFDSAPRPLLGNVLAAASGLSWALTVIGFRWIGRRPGDGEAAAFSAVVAGNVIACLGCLPWALPVRGALATDWLILVYLGVFQIGVAYVCLTSAVRHVPALEASLLLLLEPVLNPIWVWLVQGERPGPWSLGGGMLIVSATAIKSWVDVRAAALTPASGRSRV